VALAERQIGVQIFERGRQGVRLSAAGAVVVEQARRVLGAQRELEELASHLRDPFRGAFRLGKEGLASVQVDGIPVGPTTPDQFCARTPRRACSRASEAHD
jgi:DNA-binding transcriptional LysR family regulator